MLLHHASSWLSLVTTQQLSLCFAPFPTNFKNSDSMPAHFPGAAPAPLRRRCMSIPPSNPEACYSLKHDWIRSFGLLSFNRCTPVKSLFYTPGCPSDGTFVADYGSGSLAHVFRDEILHFTSRRYASGVYAVVACPSVCLSDSVCLSHDDIVSKRVDGSIWFLAWTLPST